MIIFLYGPDDYRRSQRKREYLAEFVKKRSAQGVAVFDLTADDVRDELATFLENQELFASAKLAILENAFLGDAAALAKLIAPYAKHPTVNILLSEADKPVKVLAFLLKAPVYAQEFKDQTGVLLEKFAITEAKRHGLVLDPAAARHLAGVFAKDSWGLATEIEKLAAFAPKVTKHDLEWFDLDIAPVYWSLITGVRSVNLKDRLTALETLFSIGDPPPKIFNILASQWREKTHEMAEYDFAVKSGKLEYDDALLGLVL
jgi:DNA polymerase III delta subunit